MNQRIPLRIDQQVAAALKEIGIKIAIPTRVGGGKDPTTGLGDVSSLEAARARYRNPTKASLNPFLRRFSTDATRNLPGGEELEILPQMDAEYDESAAWPFWSSNVESGYFKSYLRDQSLEASRGRGDLYLKFQSKKGDVPEGEPRGSARAYVYPDVPGFLWTAMISGTSAGGMVWDLIRREGIQFEQIA